MFIHHVFLLLPPSSPLPVRRRCSVRPRLPRRWWSSGWFKFKARNEGFHAFFDGGVEAGNTGTSKGGMVVGGGGASPNIRRVATTVGVVEGRHYQGGVGGGERAESNTTPAYHLHDHQVQHGVHHDVEVRESGDETDLLNARVLYIGYRRPTPIHPPHTHTLTPSHHHTRTREHT